MKIDESRGWRWETDRYSGVSRQGDTSDRTNEINPNSGKSHTTVTQYLYVETSSQFDPKHFQTHNKEGELTFGTDTTEGYRVADRLSVLCEVSLWTSSLFLTNTPTTDFSFDFRPLCLVTHLSAEWRGPFRPVCLPHLPMLSSLNPVTSPSFDETFVGNFKSRRISQCHARVPFVGR